jgi:hypothetical protein
VKKAGIDPAFFIYYYGFKRMDTMYTGKNSSVMHFIPSILFILSNDLEQ